MCVCVWVKCVFQEEENRLREELRQEWEGKQEKIKSKLCCSQSAVMDIMFCLISVNLAKGATESRLIPNLTWLV